jgi:ABC-type sugar transport system ATPase subunit
MDEPTSALPESAADGLLKRICAFRDAGMGIIYISHKMAEIQRIADRAAVLRDGHYIGSLSKEEITIDRIITMMAGRETKLDFHRRRESTDIKKFDRRKNYVKKNGEQNRLVFDSVICRYFFGVYCGTRGFAEQEGR